MSTVETKTTTPVTAVALARDVLRLLADKKIEAEEGVYVQAMQDWHIKHLEWSLKELLRLKDFRPCSVCAMGALLVAYVDKRNECSLRATASHCRRSISLKLAGVFSAEQLLLIECAFEGFDLVAWAKEATREFYGKYPDPSERLKAIMRNIIKHKGVFAP